MASFYDLSFLSYDLVLRVMSRPIWCKLHVSSIVQRWNVIVIGLARLRRKLPKCTRQLLIQAIVFLHIWYCLTVWGKLFEFIESTRSKSYQHCCPYSFGSQSPWSCDARSELRWSSVDELLHDGESLLADMGTLSCAVCSVPPVRLMPWPSSCCTMARHLCAKHEQ